MEEDGRAIRKIEVLCNNSINFQTRIFLLRIMGDQDLMVLMPHGNWSWRPFSQLANQLTTCRQKTTGTYFAGDSDSDASNLGRLSHGRVSRAPWIDLTCLRQLTKLLVWPASSPVPPPLPPLTILRQLTDKEAATPDSADERHSPEIAKPFMEKPSANQYGGTAQNFDLAFSLKISVFISIESTEDS